jgi:hypothetical protein
MTFGPDTYENDSFDRDNLGKEVVIYFNAVNAYGILESVQGGMIKLNPCLVSQPTVIGELMYKMMDRPAVFPVSGSVLLPIDKGTLDTMLSNQERELKEKKSKEGGGENGC